MCAGTGHLVTRHNGLMVPSPDGSEAADFARRGGTLPDGTRVAVLSRRIAKLVAVVVMGMVLWIGYLAVVLPRHYDARHWTLLWVGFDVFEIVALCWLAWALWFRREILIVAALITGTLFACDAWFDVITSLGSGGEWVTIVTAVGAELPAAAACFWIAHRGLRRTLLALRAPSGQPSPPFRLRDALLPDVDLPPAASPSTSPPSPPPAPSGSGPVPGS